MARTSLDGNAHPYGPTVGRLVDEFARLPGIGRKTAERLTQHILRCSNEDANALAVAIQNVKASVGRCTVCFNLTEQEVCRICSDPRRDRRSVCIVEQPKDAAAIEASGAFMGVYTFSGGRIAPLDGIGPEDLTINQLVKRVRQDEVTEIIMATNPTLEGDGTALFITNLLEPYNLKVYTPGERIASGSVLEFANREMLSDAMRGRQEF